MGPARCNTDKTFFKAPVPPRADGGIVKEREGSSLGRRLVPGGFRPARELANLGADERMN